MADVIVILAFLRPLATVLLATSVITVLFLGVIVPFLLNSSIEPVNNVVFWTANNLVHPFWGGLAIASTMAGIISTTLTIFIYAVFGLSRDLFERASVQTLSEDQRLIATRIAQIIVVAAVIGVALTEPLGIYWLAAWAGSLFAVAWAPMIIAGLEWERANKYGALASMVGGAATYILLYQASHVWGIFTMSLGMDPVLPALVLSIGLMIVGSLLGDPTAEEVEFYRGMNDISLSDQVIEANSREDLTKKYIRTRNRVRTYRAQRAGLRRPVRRHRAPADLSSHRHSSLRRRPTRGARGSPSRECDR
jgi:Na+/proline symporter